MPAPATSLARALWMVVEPIHAVVYFDAGATADYEAAGLDGFWMGYFASRSAALGRVPHEVVTATFFNFEPGMVRRAFTPAWERATPADVLAVRLRVAERALRGFLDGATGDTVASAVLPARRLSEACDPAGRPLFAGHAGLQRPEDPLVDLWHSCTLLREHRGDGHIAALVAEGVGPCQSHLLAAATGVTTAEMQRRSRQWSAEPWEEAVDDLRSRGWIEGDLSLTPAGAEVKARVEETTDRLATQPFGALDDAGLSGLVKALGQLRNRVVAGGVMPFPNPIGLPRR